MRFKSFQREKKRRRGDRSAMTLVEVMVVTVLASMVFGVVISFMIAVLKKDRELRRFEIETDRQSELAETLRTDIRGADEVSLAAQTVLVINAPGEREIRYELTGVGCRRIVSLRGDKPSVDFFAIGPRDEWSLKDGPSGRLPLYVVSLLRAAEKGETDSPGMPFIVYAALGADLAVKNR